RFGNLNHRRNLRGRSFYRPGLDSFLPQLSRNLGEPCRTSVVTLLSKNPGQSARRLGCPVGPAFAGYFDNAGENVNMVREDFQGVFELRKSFVDQPVTREQVAVVDGFSDGGLVRLRRSSLRRRRLLRSLNPLHTYSWLLYSDFRRLRSLILLALLFERLPQQTLVVTVSGLTQAELLINPLGFLKVASLEISAAQCFEDIGQPNFVTRLLTHLLNEFESRNVLRGFGPDLPQTFHERPRLAFPDQVVGDLCQGAERRVEFLAVTTKHDERGYGREVSRIGAKGFERQVARAFDVICCEVCIAQHLARFGLGKHCRHSGEDCDGLGRFLAPEGHACPEQWNSLILRVEVSRLFKVGRCQYQIAAAQEDLRRPDVDLRGLLFLVHFFTEIRQPGACRNVLGIKLDNLVKDFKRLVGLASLPVIFDGLHELLSCLASQALHLVEFGQLEHRLDGSGIQLCDLPVNGNCLDGEALLDIGIGQLVEESQGLSKVPLPNIQVSHRVQQGEVRRIVLQDVQVLPDGLRH